LISDIDQREYNTLYSEDTDDDVDFPQKQERTLRDTLKWRNIPYDINEPIWWQAVQTRSPDTGYDTTRGTILRRGMMFKTRSENIWEGKLIYEFLGYDDHDQSKMTIRSWRPKNKKENFGPGVIFETIDRYKGLAGNKHISIEKLLPQSNRVIYQCHTHGSNPSRRLNYD
jgi:hypothetical protein